MNISQGSTDEDLEMDMTPMIDVVFLLIIFFMVITDLSQKDLEALKLPISLHATPDKPDPAEYRPILNITQQGKIIEKGNTYFDVEKDKGPRDTRFKRLRTRMTEMVGWMRKKEGLVNGEDPDGGLLIRSDQSAPFSYVQFVMETAAHESVGIWKLELAASVSEDN